MNHFDIIKYCSYRYEWVMRRLLSMQNLGQFDLIPSSKASKALGFHHNLVFMFLHKNQNQISKEIDKDRPMQSLLDLHELSNTELGILKSA